MIFHDFTYNQLAQEVLKYGTLRGNRTGTDTISLFGGRMEFNLKQGFPLLTGKYVSLHAVATELFWFMEGRTDVAYLRDRGVTIWDEWVKEDGTIGPGYGAQWRNFGGVDQLDNVVHRILANPLDRRLVVSAWNPPVLDEMALPPCHLMFQFYVDGCNLECQIYQRSADMFLGVPYNIASYALLTHVVAYLTNLIPSRLIWVGGDCHFYVNHLEQIDIQLRRSYRPSPSLNVICGSPAGLNGWEFDEHVYLRNYNPHPLIKAKVAV